MELLGSSLVFKEKEVLLDFKEKLEISKIDKDPKGYERRALLELSSDSEESESETNAEKYSTDEQEKE